MAEPIPFLSYSELTPFLGTFSPVPFPVPHRAVLALDAGAVEAQGRHAVDHALDAEDTLVPALAGLGLGQVSCLQRDGFHLSHRDQDLLCGGELGTVLMGSIKREGEVTAAVVCLQVWPGLSLPARVAGLMSQHVLHAQDQPISIYPHSCWLSAEIRNPPLQSPCSGTGTDFLTAVTEKGTFGE